jgi:hypothetical protein
MRTAKGWSWLQAVVAASTAGVWSHAGVDGPMRKPNEKQPIIIDHHPTLSERIHIRNLREVATPRTQTFADSTSKQAAEQFELSRRAGMSLEIIRNGRSAESW